MGENVKCVAHAAVAGDDTAEAGERRGWGTPAVAGNEVSITNYVVVCFVVPNG